MLFAGFLSYLAPGHRKLVISQETGHQIWKGRVTGRRFKEGENQNGWLSLRTRSCIHKSH